MAPDTVLITGSNGFIGSSIAAALRGRVRTVGVSTGSVNFPGATDVYEQMSLPHADLELVLRRHAPRFCIHCAGPASVGRSMDHPAVDFQSGPVALFQIADAIRKTGVDCTIIFPSSAAVYGNPETIPVAEDASVSPISPYGFHKHLGEEILREFRDIYGVPHVILRIFSCYGEGLRKQLFWDVCRKIASGDLALFGTGQETRDFIHVEDLAGVVLKIMEDDVKSRVLNVGNGSETSVARVVELLRLEFGDAPQAVFRGENRHGDPLRWAADISGIESLGYRQRVPLEEGVARYVRWFRETAHG